jgi:hypothetical protein
MGAPDRGLQVTTPSGRRRFRPLVALERLLGMERLDDGPPVDGTPSDAPATTADGRSSDDPAAGAPMSARARRPSSGALVEPVAVAPRSTRAPEPEAPAVGAGPEAPADPEPTRTNA